MESDRPSLPPFSLDIYKSIIDHSSIACLTVTDPSEQLTYVNIIGAIQHYMPETQVQAFQYKDEEGDFITVRTDRETEEMIRVYMTCQYDQSSHAFIEPLIIYPSGQDSAGRRHPDLHVEVSPSGSVSSHIGSGGMHSASSLNAIGSATSLGSMNGSPDPTKLQQIMNGPLSSENNQLSLDQLQYNPETDRLGTGNGGSVFKVFHKTTGSIIALKIIALDVKSPDVQKQIISELQILHRCKSPFIISFWGASFQGNEIYIATEFMDGGSLERYMPIEEDVLGRISVMVIHGLQYLWEMGIMHRDVKPSNMLVNTQGIVKLCDFGVSRQLIQSTALTYCGTQAYMSPERLNENKGYKIQSDLWSLGVSLYEMADGQLPFHISTLNSPMLLFNNISEGKMSKLSTSRFKPEICVFVNQCLQKQPDRRPHPRTITDHPFIIKYNDGNTTIVAEWLRGRMARLNSQYSHRGSL